MRNKIILLAGIGIGYVLGSRAGRGRYEQIKRGWLSFWNSPGVQTQVQNAQEFVTDKAPDVVDFVSDTAKKFVTRGDGAKAKPAAKSKSNSNAKSKSTSNSTSSKSTNGSSSSAAGSK